MNFCGYNLCEILKDNINLSRFSKAFSNEYSPYYVSTESLAGTFYSDQKTIVCYLANSNCCNCDEYREKHNNIQYPCSHMYRLGHELGIIDKDANILFSNDSNDLSNEEIDSLFINIIEEFEKEFTYTEQLNLFNHTNQLFSKIST